MMYNVLMYGKAEGKEVQRGAGFEEAGECVGIRRCVGFEHGNVGEEDFIVGPL